MPHTTSSNAFSWQKIVVVWFQIWLKCVLRHPVNNIPDNGLTQNSRQRISEAMMTYFNHACMRLGLDGLNRKGLKYFEEYDYMYVLAFPFIPPHWNDKDSWNRSSWMEDKERFIRYSQYILHITMIIMPSLYTLHESPEIILHPTFYFIVCMLSITKMVGELEYSPADLKQIFLLTICIAIVNALRHSNEFMCQKTNPPLVWIMICRLYGAKPLSEPVLPYC